MYKQLRESTNLKEIGTFPQGGKVLSSYDFNAPNSMWAVREHSGRKLPFDPDFGTIELKKQAKITDVLSLGALSGSGFFVSKNLKSILEEFNLPEHVFYPVEFVKLDVNYEYYWLHLISNLVDKIDFTRSEFIYGLKTEKSYSRFGSLAEYLDFRNNIEEHGFLRAKTLHFVKSFSTNLDILYIGFFDKRIYISARLEKVLREHGITGIDISIPKVLQFNQELS